MDEKIGNEMGREGGESREIFHQSGSGVGGSELSVGDGGSIQKSNGDGTSGEMMEVKMEDGDGDSMEGVEKT